MAQYPIPQFIESEGRIVSFLTFRQFFVLIGGGVICFVLYYVLPTFLFVIFAIPIVLLTAVIAFLKVNDMFITTVVFNFITFSMKEKNYTWKKKKNPYPFTPKKTYKTNQVENVTEPEPRTDLLKQAREMVEFRKK